MKSWGWASIFTWGMVKSWLYFSRPPWYCDCSFWWTHYNVMIPLVLDLVSPSEFCELTSVLTCISFAIQSWAFQAKTFLHGEIGLSTQFRCQFLVKNISLLFRTLFYRVWTLSVHICKPDGVKTMKKACACCHSPLESDFSRSQNQTRLPWMLEWDTLKNQIRGHNLDISNAVMLTIF